MALPKYEASRNRVYYKYKIRSVGRGIPFDLSVEQFTTISERRCHYCGAKPSPSKSKTHQNLNGNWLCNGLDRIDNSKGYLLSNVQACCFPCNQLKSSRDENEFLSQITAIAMHLGLACLKDENG